MYIFVHFHTCSKFLVYELWIISSPSVHGPFSVFQQTLFCRQLRLLPTFPAAQCYTTRAEMEQTLCAENRSMGPWAPKNPENPPENYGGTQSGLFSGSSRWSAMIRYWEGAKGVFLWCALMVCSVKHLNSESLQACNCDVEESTWVSLSRIHYLYNSFWSLHVNHYLLDCHNLNLVGVTVLTIANLKLARCANVITSSANMSNFSPSKRWRFNIRAVRTIYF